MCVRFFGGSKWWRVQPSRVREFVFYAPKIGSHFFDRRIRQHFAPPVGITFKDADSGKTVHFDGSYRIESYQTSPNLR